MVNKKSNFDDMPVTGEAKLFYAFYEFGKQDMDESAVSVIASAIASGQSAARDAATRDSGEPLE